MTSSEQRQFTVAPSIIQHLIHSQAGSLAKAIVECVQNSIDAGASRVDITLDISSVRVSDDGHGLRSRDEVLACFEVFGFDHATHAREFGPFGLGRGQLWAWASTIWRTHGFELDVDVRVRGLNWNLRQDLPEQPGLVIDGRLYKALTNVEVVQTSNELERICRYSQVPVMLNGRCISRDPAREKWTEVTDDAWFRAGEGSYLEVYNQGIYVAGVYTGQVGVAGTLVTKRGRALALNMARNDILRAECPIWQALEPLLKRHSAKRRERSGGTRMTASDRDYLAAQSIDPANAELLERPVFTLVNGRSVGLENLMRLYAGTQALCAAQSGDRLGEQLHRDHAACVVSEVTLTRFGVTTPTELAAALLERVEAAKAIEPPRQRWERSSWGHYADILRDPTYQAYDELAQCPGARQLEAKKIPDADLTAEQRAFLIAFAGGCAVVSDVVCAYEQAPGREPRKLILAECATADAYTDGDTYVALAADTVKAAIGQGLPGFLRIAHLLLHEQLHDVDSSGSHAHDQEFCEHFHNIAIDHGARLFDLAATAFQTFATHRARMSAKTARSLDLINKSAASVSAAAPAAAAA